MKQLSVAWEQGRGRRCFHAITTPTGRQFLFSRRRHTAGRSIQRRRYSRSFSLPGGRYVFRAIFRHSACHYTSHVHAPAACHGRVYHLLDKLTSQNRGSIRDEEKVCPPLIVPKAAPHHTSNTMPWFSLVYCLPQRTISLPPALRARQHHGMPTSER